MAKSNPFAEVGKQISDPAYLETLGKMTGSEHREFLSDPHAWLAKAGFAVPEGLAFQTEGSAPVRAEPIQAESFNPTGDDGGTSGADDFHLGKFKICVHSPLVSGCYVHGTGQHV